MMLVIVLMVGLGETVEANQLVDSGVDDLDTHKTGGEG
jgi:hypothetical protein